MSFKQFKGQADELKKTNESKMPGYVGLFCKLRLLLNLNCTGLYVYYHLCTV